MGAFNGSMLRLARQFRGFHQKDLAELLCVDAAILSRAENGALEPSSAVLDKCAASLRVKRNFFEMTYHPSGLPFSFHPMWRKRQAVPQREVDRVLADANMRVLQLRAMMPSVAFEPSLPLPHYEPGEYGAGPREIAARVRRAWGLPAGPLQNLTDCVERTGVFVFHADLEKIDVDGLSLRPTGLPPLIVLNKALPADRMRFTLAHEYGHLVMHGIPSEEMEKEANTFASSLLLPQDDLAPYFRGRKIDVQLLARLKPEWRVSMAALLYAADELGFLGPGQKQGLWKKFSAMGYRRSEPQELDFVPEPTMLDKRLMQVHLSDLHYTVDDLAALFGIEAEDIYQMYSIPKPRNGLRLVG